MTKEEITALIKQTVSQSMNANYYAGNPKVPPHTHNRADNLPVANSTSTGAGKIGIGGIYLTTTTNNPSTEVGYGTWSLIAEGQTIAGFKSGDANFGTLGASVGQATHILTDVESPLHYHGVWIGATGGTGNSSLNVTTGISTNGANVGFLSSNQGVTNQNLLSWTSTLSLGATSANLSSAWTFGTGSYNVQFIGTSEVRTVSFTNGSTAATWSPALSHAEPAGFLVGNGAHNNVQPTLVINLWKRTA